MPHTLRMIWLEYCQLKNSYALVDRVSHNLTDVSMNVLRFSFHFRGKNVPANMDHKKECYIKICSSYGNI